MATSTTTKKSATKRTPVKPVERVSKTAGAVDAVAAGTRLVHEISPDLIDPHPANPRRDLGDLTELADSIRAHGIQQPITVVPHPDDSSRYRALMGHRRLAAAVAVELEKVPVLIATGLSDADQLEVMLVENLQRTDLTISEEGAGYQGLLDLGVTQSAIAKRTGRAKSTVATRVRIAALPDGARYHVDHHQITIEEALALADLEAADPELYADACEKLTNPHTANPSAVVRSAKEERATRELLAEKTAEWAVKGWALKVGNIPNGAHRLSRLGGTFMTIEEHTNCPAGEVYIHGAYSWVLANIEFHGHFVCTDAAKHHAKEIAAWEAAVNAPPQQQELSDEERAAVERREAAHASRDARLMYLADVLTRDTDDAQPLIDFVNDLAAAIASHSGETAIEGLQDEWYPQLLVNELPRQIARPERAPIVVLIRGVDEYLIGTNQSISASVKYLGLDDLTLLTNYIDALIAAGHTASDHEESLFNLAREALAEILEDTADTAPEGDES